MAFDNLTALERFDLWVAMGIAERAVGLQSMPYDIPVIGWGPADKAKELVGNAAKTLERLCYGDA